MRPQILNLIKYKDLFVELVNKDIKLKYRNSILGVFWSLLNPLLMTAVLSIVFMALFRNDIPNFPVYVLIGRVLYQFFSESTTFAMDAIHANGQLIRKVYVPKYFFPLARVVSTFLTTIISLLTVIVMMAFFGIPFRWINLLSIIPLFYLLITVSGIGLLLASINVFFKDMKHFYSVILLVVMYMTPIFYPSSIIPDQYKLLVMLNPLFPIVEMFRDVLLNEKMFEPNLHLLSIVYMFFYSGLGLLVFYKTQDRFIYHL